MHVGHMLVLDAMFNSLEGLEASVPKFLGLMVVAWFLILAVPASSFDDDLICQDFQDAADTMNKDRGKMVDVITRTDGVTVLCGVKILQFKKFLFTSPKALRPGWQARKQSQWNDLYCQGDFRRIILENGWTVSQEWIFEDGARFLMKAECE